MHSIWYVFKMFELTEVIRQRSDPLVHDILNAARIGELFDKDADVLNCWKGDFESVLTQAPVIFAENSPKDS